MQRSLGAFFQVGGVKSLEPILREMVAEGSLEIWARDPVLRYLASVGIPATPVTGQLVRETAFGEYGMVLTDTINMARSDDAPLIGMTWEAARRAGVPSLAFVDSWWGYDNRFFDPGNGGRSILPDRIAVVDDIARRGMLEAGHSADMLTILGSPYLDTLRQERETAAARGAGFRSGLGLDDAFVCLFVSQPLERSLPGGAAEWGFNELTTLAALGERAALLPEDVRERFRLLVLPHPEDDVAALRAAAEALPVSCKVIEGAAPLDAVCGADLVCGMFSILLTEAVLLGRVVLSVQLGLSREDMLVTNMIGATCCARTPDDLATLFEGLTCRPERRAEALAAQERFSVVGDSRRRWIEQLKYARMESR